MTIRNLLNNRKSDILKQLRLLRFELVEIKQLEYALNNRKSPARILKTPKLFTFKDMAVKALENRDGATSAELVKLIQSIFNKRIQRSSLSPQLSRLKEMGILELKDDKWSLSNSTSPALNENPRNDL